VAGSAAECQCSSTPAEFNPFSDAEIKWRQELRCCLSDCVWIGRLESRISATAATPSRSRAEAIAATVEHPGRG